MEVARITGKAIPEELAKERGRVVDAIADSSAHIHGKKFAIYGDPDLCLGLAGFLLELGAEPTHVLATNGSKAWAEKVQALLDSSPFGKNCHVYAGKDLWHMRSLLFTEPVDFLIGNTYGKYLERDTGTPLIRIGFPIFDRHHHHRYPVWGYQGGMNVLVWILDKIFDEIDKQHHRGVEDGFQLRHHSMNALSGQTSRGVRRARLRQEPGQVGEGAQERLHQAARAGRGRRGLRLRRRQDRAAADHRCRAPGARTDRLRGQLLGQPPRAVLRADDLPDWLHHRHQRARRRLRRREAPVQVDQGNHRQVQSPGGVRLPDLRPGHDRRRHRGGLQGAPARNSASR